MGKVNNINIGGKTYPILCDLNVLDTLQEEFGSVAEFERKLLGLRLVKEKDGKQKYNADGTPAMELVEPSIKAIKIALVEMINEGIAYSAYSKGQSWEMVEDIDILAECSVPYSELSTLIHNEYKRCFATKKTMPREPKKKRTPQSTSLG